MPSSSLCLHFYCQQCLNKVEEAAATKTQRGAPDARGPFRLLVLVFLPLKDSSGHQMVFKELTDIKTLRLDTWIRFRNDMSLHVI